MNFLLPEAKYADDPRNMNDCDVCVQCEENSVGKGDICCSGDCLERYEEVEAQMLLSMISCIEWRHDRLGTAQMLYNLCKKQGYDDLCVELINLARYHCKIIDIN